MVENQLVLGALISAVAARRCPVRRVAGCQFLSVLVLMLIAAPAFAQSPDAPARVEESSLLWDVAKAAVVDPTTYAPAATAYGAMRLDWESSQVLFQHGYVEDNPRYTISGRSYDVPLSYAEGNRKILRDSLQILQMSVVNNLTVNFVERVLIQRHPNHKKLFRTIGWIERVGFASYWSYRLSAGHLRAWQDNERLARQLGYR
jgi:hypothetical protein